MPHLFVNRPRLFGLTRGPAELWAHHRWETINAAVYDLGGVIFVVGSVLFLLGGVFNYWRASIVIHKDMSRSRSLPPRS